jgi:hypothetical protein
VDLAFLSAYAAGMFFAGHLGDRMDLRIFLSIGMLGSGIFCCLFGWVSGPVHSTKQLTNSRRLASETLCSWIAKMYVVDSSVIVATSITAVVWRSGADAVVLPVQAYLWDIHSMAFFRTTMVSAAAAGCFAKGHQLTAYCMHVLHSICCCAACTCSGHGGSNVAHMY